MKLVGFIKEHNNIVEAQEYSFFKGNISRNQGIDDKIIDYLNSGVLVLAWMGYFTDVEDRSLISPDSYYTDGVYVWPSYFSYYLKKHPNYLIDEEFLSHVLKSNYLVDQTNIKEDLKTKLEASLSRKLNNSWDK